MLAMLSHLLAAVSSVLVIKKYEDYLKRLGHFSLFNVNNFCAQRLWFVLLSLCVSFGYLIFGAEHFVRNLSAFNGLNTVKYVLMNLAVGTMILQYNYYILKDRRNKNTKE